MIKSHEAKRVDLARPPVALAVPNSRWGKTGTGWDRDPSTLFSDNHKDTQQGSRGYRRTTTRAWTFAGVGLARLRFCYSTRIKYPGIFSQRPATAGSVV